MIAGTKCWGKHASFDCRNCNDRVSDKASILEFGDLLIKKIKMVAHGSPQCVHFGEGDKAGYTYSQLIQTSNICAHFCDEGRNAYIDVFSCRDFNFREISDLIYAFFDAEEVKVRCVLRGVDF